MRVTSYHNPARVSASASRQDHSHTITSVKEDFLAQFFDQNGNLRQEFQKKQFPDGGEYIGTYTDCRQGKGIYSFPNKDVFMGNWKEDRFNGEGAYIYSSGERFQGKFLEGKKHGRGIYIYKSGATYDGEWHKDKKNGFGIFAYANN